MGTLPNKKYPQVVTRQEVAFLVLGYLKEEKFKQTLEIFEKEAKNVIKNMKLASKKVKGLHSILNEYIFLKNEEKKKTKFVNTFGQDPHTKKTMLNLHDLLEDYSMYREMFLPQRPSRDLDDPIPVSKPNKNPTPAHTPAINTPMTAIANTPMNLNMNTPSTMMQIDPPQIEIPPAMEVHNNDNQKINNTNVMDIVNNTSPSNTNSRPVPQLPVIEILESPAPKQAVQRTAEESTTNNNNNNITSEISTDNATMLLSPTNTNKTVARTPITSTPRRKPKPRKYSPSPKAKQSLNFDADADTNQVPDEMSREFMENGFKLLMQNQPLQQKLADLINSRLTSPEPVVADPNEWIPPNAIDEILNSLTADPMFEPLFQSEHVDTLNLSHQSNDSLSSNNINPAAHQTVDSNPNNNTIMANMSNHSNNNNNNIDRDTSFERLNTSTDNLLNFNTFDKAYQTNTYVHTDEIDFAALLNTSTEEVDQHAQNTASFFHSILQSTETLTPLNEELDHVHDNAQSGDNNTHVPDMSNNNNTNATIVVPQQIEEHDKNGQRHVSTEWRNFLNNSNTVNAVQNADSNSAIMHNNNSNSNDENSKSKTSQRRKRKLLGTKRTASTLGGETEQQNKKQKLDQTKLPENLDVELFLSQLNYK